ncbi:DEAD/DEAH box helicase [Pseudomonas aeruginosa]|uniref:type I restriction endonuclease subunit R n=1 Tax=Pseudomonadaceae TaxID=135621 RepID=UPI000281A2B7|nr:MULTISPECIES: HsdR family type I site-specific deoxyribonuclease [Pseudomonadaceae]AVZ36911.1 DEAD/DEAH box helicase [Pseudomonas aeruginosa]EKA39521.1 restriction enzyme type I helicase [Pseudomonas aeruginosa ATCC 25324]MBX5991707.1 HsdR family type I site-specific deoxyribonuclease [Pseudomonas aeruginosa]MBY9968739.1 HsdR family type I site-specific deoxyribonuclease [Pseudomonas aeruginosa]MBY9975154.1 HsdR family type I site-specific deoxyribonuclease [Pseudomonas aeruginosa]
MFTESNTVEAYLYDLLSGPAKSTPANVVQEPEATYGRSHKGIGWRRIASAEIPRQHQDVLVEPWVREALIRLNPEIAAQPDRADEVLYKLRAIVLSVRSDGLIRANEEFTGWLRGERSMPFGQNNEHVPVRLIDFDSLDQNQYVVTQQFTFRAGSAERRADLILLVNGLPLVLIEAKTPTRSAVSWVDGALQVHDDYEKHVPELFVCNVFSVATEGKEYRYGSLGLPIKDWGPWNLEDDGDALKHPLKGLKLAAESMLRPHVVLDILANFTLFATNKKKQRIKIICRYQQYEAANKIVERVLAGYPKKGLIWHFQGSGKSLLMVFAAQKLRLHPRLKNPTVLIVVDRVDLDTQITGTFTGADIPNLEKADSRDKLRQLLAQDVRKIIITTIFKFGEADGVLNDRGNIIALVDEAHRTQEGDLGRKMRDALPNAFLFGLTGTPINRFDRNTFYAFGAEEDDKGYLSRYGFEESIRDGATLKLHFEPRLLELHIDKAAIDAAFKEMTGGLSDLDRDNLGKTAAKMAVLVKTPERIGRVCEDIVQHFQSKVEPNGFKGQIVTFDRESCLLYKQELDKLLPPEVSDIVMTVNANEPQYKAYARTRDEEERLLDRFRDPNDPLKLIIVTSKLLTGFDAPILQAMYLDKPLRDHTLLQAICRVNRTYSEQKTHGLIVDYLGIFDDVAKALEFDDKSVTAVVSNIQELKDRLPEAMQKCLAFFAGVDRTVEGYEGLIAAQQCLPNNEVRDNFAVEYSLLNKLWEAISPDPILGEYEKDYKWLSQVYQSVQPSSGHGKLIWHSLGAKTIELIHQNVHVDAVRDDLDTLVLDADLLEAVLSNPDPKKVKEIEIKVARRLRKHLGNPKFKALSERLDALRDRFESGVLNSVEFLKQLLQLAKEVLQAEKETPPEEDEDRGKAALTELFNEVKTAETPIMVERVVADIDEIVRLVRFPGWQDTLAGEREIKKALRKSLFKYKLHADEELFEKAYSYIRQYY